jgi:hypothetical protein
MNPPTVVLAYGLLEIAQVPWETLCAEYRTTHGPAATLEATARSFCRWVQESPHLTEQMKTEWWKIWLKHLVSDFLPELSAQPPVSNRRFGRIADAIKCELDRLRRLETWLEDVDAEDVKSQLKDNEQEYDQATFRLAEAGFTTERRAALIEILALSTCKSAGLPNSTGLVFIGYGRDEVLPGYVQVDTVTVEREWIRISTPKPVSINTGRPSVATGFAERNETMAFLDGVQPDLKDAILQSHLNNENVLKAVERTIDGIEQRMGSEDESVAVLRELLKRHTSMAVMVQSYNDEASGSLRQGLTQAPREDLARFTRSLVEMEAWRHRLATCEAETVGGPIKVMTLSRAAGIEVLE